MLANTPHPVGAKHAGTLVAMAITPAQIKTSQKALAIVILVFVATFFFPSPPMVPVQGTITSTGYTTFKASLGRAETLVIYAEDPHTTCSDTGVSDKGIGSSLTTSIFVGPRDFEGKTFYPAGTRTGPLVGHVFRCHSTGQLVTASSLFTNPDSLALWRGGILFLAAVFGWYVLVGLRRSLTSSSTRARN